MQFLYVSVNIKEKIKVDIESMNVGFSFVVDLEDIEVVVVVKFNEFVFVDGLDMELMFDGGDQRGMLEESISKGFKGMGEFGLVVGDFVVQVDNVNVFFFGILLGFDEVSGVVDIDDQVVGNFGVECFVVVGFFIFG